MPNAKCGCSLNAEGRGHWSGCPEAVSETAPAIGIKGGIIDLTASAEATEKFELDVTFDNGESCNIVFTYPKGRALTALHAIRKIGEPEYITGLLGALRDDPSVAESMDKAGMSFSDEDEGTGFDEPEEDADG